MVFINLNCYTAITDLVWSFSLKSEMLW